MRKFLVVMDESPEFLNAIHYAAARAAKSDGAVEILGIIGPEEFQHWLGVADAMRAEARQRIKARFKEFSTWMVEKEGIEPELVIREGEHATEVIAQINADKEVGVLVLGAGTSGEGPGPLVTQLVSRQGGDLPVPVTIVPGSMSKEAIKAVS